MTDTATTIWTAFLVALAATLFTCTTCWASEEFLQSLELREFRFPEDHADHPGFRTEWWYYTGNLMSKDKKAFGFQLTFFRVQLRPGSIASNSPWRSNQLYFAHSTVTDVERGTFFSGEKAGRGAMGSAGVMRDSEMIRVFLGSWEAVIEGNTHTLRAHGDGFKIELKLVSQKPAVLHGKNGRSQKGIGREQASYYYSLTRLKSAGHLMLGSRRLEVLGYSWMDHEFTSNVLSKDQVGWDWMGLQFSDNRELMLYVLRHRDGSIDPFSSGTLIKNDGTTIHLSREDFAVKPTDFWYSRQSRARYPSGWQVTVFPYSLDLRVTPNLKNQELITSESTKVTYWEGSVRASGRQGAKKLTGSGYVELTGYAGEFNPDLQKP